MQKKRTDAWPDNLGEGAVSALILICRSKII